MKFDLSRSWNDGVAKLRDNFQLLALIAGLFLFIPSALFAVTTPDLMSQAMASPMNPSDPAAMLALFTPTIVIGYLLITLLSFVGYMAMLALMDDRRKPTTGDAIAHGFRSLPTLIGATLLFIVGYVIVIGIISVVVGLLIGAITAVSTTIGAILSFMLVVAMFIAILWAFTRFSMTMPVIAIGKVMNPIVALKQSWALTRTSQWRLLAFYILLFIAYAVIALLVFGLLGLVLGAVGGFTVLIFLSALLSAFVGMLFCAVLAGIYAQLTGSSGANLADTRE